MLEAIIAVQNKTMGYQLASLKYGVPRSTLAKRVKGKSKEARETVKYIEGRKKILLVSMEDEVVNYILKM